MNDTPHVTQPADQGSFLNGFALGLFAGAAGYYLFGTDRGKKLTTQLKTEWLQAQREISELPDALKSATPELSIAEVARKVVQYIAAASGTDVSRKTAPKTTRKSSEKSNTKFKGV